ncbi:MAG: transketolase [Actinomycetota bacterium]|nr:transketolase [Actinomycetota bacterium]MDQ6946620.1 transketolase [Actinomycetota bacterium]
MSREIRRIILSQSRRAHVGHIGSCLSVVEIAAALYGGILRVERPDDPARDRFILSKGHNALTIYAALSLRGWLSSAELDTFCGDASRLGVHPDQGVVGVDFSTGSLGQGLSWAAGGALAARLQGSNRRVFCLVSDAECNEGSTWEAVMFAAHHRLSNLIVVVDVNGQQALGYTADVLDLSPLAGRWRTFGWETHEVDGHSITALSEAAAGLDTSEGPPHVLIAHTVFGKGVSFMEGQIRWHYLPMSEEEYRHAMNEINQN